MKITTIICTYNRGSILNVVLESLCAQIRNMDSFEIIVIDNNSNDDTESIIKDYQIVEPRIKYILERNQGLSYARNIGATEATNDWLFFLDDDAKLLPDSLSHIIEMTKEFDLCTGIWKAWYKSPPPKWLPHSTGNYILKGTDEIRDIGEDFVSGGVMLINKQKLLEIGGFPTHLGMTGDKVAYGEETYVEEEFKKRGWKVGINPNIVIDHLVGEHKYKLNWHLESAYAKGRDTQMIHRSMNKMTARLRFIKIVISGWVKPLVKLISRSEYYRQNFVIDYVGGIRFYKGVLDSFEK